ncbi:aquaporin AQPAn.G-like isoform X1 [Cloeon dipterum]|uniref:aquaporin AQPAn.G-like isoform X1 n=1 Tax=Cloeon dipterum TaxID=197152 RepID=UPI0032207624
MSSEQQESILAAPASTARGPRRAAGKSNFWGYRATVDANANETLFYTHCASASQTLRMTTDKGKKAMSRKPNVFRVVFAEFLATALLVGVGCASCTAALSHKDALQSPVITSLSFGLVVGILVQIFGHISGAHLNPAVTVCAVILKEIPLKWMFAYILSQIFGGIAGYAILMLITPAAIIREDSHQDFGFCTTVPNLELSTFSAFCTEFVATSMLILLVCSSWDARNPNSQNLPTQFALGITALGIVFGSRTGPSMNPARTFGPAVWNGVWTKHWIYWIGPVFAAVLVTTIYKSIFGFRNNLRADEEEDANEMQVLGVANPNMPA